MINLAQFSGGKDSTAMLLWMIEQGIEFTPIFCDTSWEHPLTYAYIEEINQTVLGGRLVTLRSDKYEGFEDLCVKRKLVPGKMTRFCTQELKIFPMHRYIESLPNADVRVFIGIRADESLARSRDTETQWCEDAGGYWINRPLLRWTAAQCFDLMKRHGVRPNPLYLMGAARVGCWTCVFVGLRELRALLRNTPEIKQRLRDLEQRLNPEGWNVDSPRTFFRADYIPARFSSLRVKKKDGRTVNVPTCDDVFRYLESVDENQLPLFEAPKCISIYNLCE